MVSPKLLFGSFRIGELPLVLASGVTKLTGILKRVVSRDEYYCLSTVSIPILVYYPKR